MLIFILFSIIGLKSEAFDDHCERINSLKDKIDLTSIKIKQAAEIEDIDPVDEMNTMIKLQTQLEAAKADCNCKKKN